MGAEAAERVGVDHCFAMEEEGCDFGCDCDSSCRNDRETAEVDAWGTNCVTWSGECYFHSAHCRWKEENEDQLSYLDLGSGYDCELSASN